MIPDWRDGMEIEGRSDSGVRVRLWKEGRYKLETPQSDQLALDIAEMPEPLTLTGPWEVRFASGWGAPESIAFDRLIAWNEHPHEGEAPGTGGAAISFQQLSWT